MLKLQHLFFPLSNKVFINSAQSLSTAVHQSGTMAELLEVMKASVPPLHAKGHKGQAGRIGVVGGCQEYTGAPYFAAISALKVGADLSHVFCTTGAAGVIKSYSPELIVHPYLDHATAVQEVSEWLDRLHVLVVGPGLGRNPDVLKNAKGIIQEAKSRELPLVIDADGLWLVTQEPDVISGYTNAILTPNAMECSRLSNKLLGQESLDSNDASGVVERLSRALGGVTVCRKGQADLISDGEAVARCEEQGSFRRCGGQGDLLSGFLATFLHWTRSRPPSLELGSQVPSAQVVAAYGACCLARRCNRLGFAVHGRSLTASDMIAHIHEAFTQVLARE